MTRPFDYDDQQPACDEDRKEEPRPLEALKMRAARVADYIGKKHMIDKAGRYHQPEVDLKQADPKTGSLKGAETPRAWTFEDAAVARKFDQHVREQLPWYDPLTQFVCDLAASFLPRGGTLYDIGASTGNITRTLRNVLCDKNARAISVESSKEMIERFNGVGELIHAPAEEVDYMANQPDVSILFLVLMFMKPSVRIEFLRKLCWATRPGGAIIIVDKGYIASSQAAEACRRSLMASKLRAGSDANAYVAKELSLRGEQRPTDDLALFELFDEVDFEAVEIFRFGEFYGVLAIKQVF